MGIDRSDDADVPEERPDDSADRADAAGDAGQPSGEAFTRNLVWEFSPSLVAAERGDLQNEFIEITEDEANQIVERIRAKATSASGDE